MKFLKYQIIVSGKLADENERPIELVLSEKRIPYSIENEEIAKIDAYNGEYIIEDDGEPGPEEVATGPSQDNINKFMLMQAQDANDGIALAVPTLYNVWEAGKRYGYDGCEKIVKVPNLSSNFGDPYLLYRCNQPHTSQADWQPQITPALWTRIDKSHEGSESDPIPATRGMEYTYGLYYSDPEDEKTYLCKRIGEPEGGTITLHYLPHELIGHYFEEV